MLGSSPSRIQGYPQDDGIGNKESKRGEKGAWSSLVYTESQWSSCVPRNHPERRTERERKRKREWHGETKLWWARSITLFSKGTFIPWLVHRGKWKMQSHTESAQTLHLFCLYRNQDFSCIPFPQTMLCTLSSGLGGLWTFYDPFLIKVDQPENLFSLKCFFFIFLIYVSLRKC